MGVAASGPHAHPAPLRIPSDRPGVRGPCDGCAAAARGSAPSPTPALLDGARSAAAPQSGAAIKSAQGETRSPVVDVAARGRVIQAI